MQTAHEVRCLLPVTTIKCPRCSAHRCILLGDCRIFFFHIKMWSWVSHSMSVGVSCCQTCILSWVSHSMCACVSLLMTLHNRRPGSHRPALTATPVQLDLMQVGQLTAGVSWPIKADVNLQRKSLYQFSNELLMLMMLMLM